MRDAAVFAAQFWGTVCVLTAMVWAVLGVRKSRAAERAERAAMFQVEREALIYPALWSMDEAVRNAHRILAESGGNPRIAAEVTNIEAVRRDTYQACGIDCPEIGR